MNDQEWRGIAQRASPEEMNRANRSEVSCAVPSPEEEIASDEVPPLLVVRGAGPPPGRALQALL
jgi:hypothetical protein